jgi:hypothetical protein
MNAIQRGLYRHYKGNLYLVTSVATHTETHEKLVVYQSLYGDYATWVRPITMFLSSVKHDGKFVSRFKFEGDPGVEFPKVR